MQAALPHVVNLEAGMRSCSDAEVILEALAFGGRFVNLMVLRTLQPLGCCTGFIAKIGTGTPTNRIATGHLILHLINNLEIKGRTKIS